MTAGAAQSTLLADLHGELTWALGGKGPSLGVLVALPFAVDRGFLGDIDGALAKAEQLLMSRADLQVLARRLEFPPDLGPQYCGDNRLTARLRRHQSWYRAEVLGLPRGTGPRANSTSYYGNMLTAADAERGANFLTPSIFEVAQQRLREDTGVVERFRLLHNMLSSQPMCFNLFGPLVQDLDLATRLMAALLPGDVAQVVAVKLEFGPEPVSAYLGDKTAFDAYIEWRRPDGALEFMGFETKLSEPFSQKVYDRPAYRRWMTGDSPWLPEAKDGVAAVRHNQLWRDHLLAVAHRRQPGKAWRRGRLALVRHPLDLECADTAAGYRRLLRQGDDTFVEFTLEQIICAWTAAARTTAESAWLQAFRLRYMEMSASEGDAPQPDQAGLGRAPRQSVSPDIAFGPGCWALNAANHGSLCEACGKTDPRDMAGFGQQCGGGIVNTGTSCISDTYKINASSNTCVRTANNMPWVTGVMCCKN